MLHPLLYRWRYVYFHVILPSYFSLSTVRLYSFFLRPFCNFLYVAQIDVRANLLKHMHLRTRHIEIKQSVAGLIVHVHLEFDEADSGPAKDMYKAHTHIHYKLQTSVAYRSPYTYDGFPFYCSSAAACIYYEVVFQCCRSGIHSHSCSNVVETMFVNLFTHTEIKCSHTTLQKPSILSMQAIDSAYFVLSLVFPRS